MYLRTWILVFKVVLTFQDEINRQRALGMFTKALKLRPQNIWAANGIGLILVNLSPTNNF